MLVHFAKEYRKYQENLDHETRSGLKQVDSNANLTIWQLFEIKTDSPSPWTYFGTQKCFWDEVISEDRVAFSRWSVCALNAVWCSPTVNDEVGDLCGDTANSTPKQTFSEFFFKEYEIPMWVQNTWNILIQQRWEIPNTL